MSVDSPAGENATGEDAAGESAASRDPASERGDRHQAFTCGACGASTDTAAGHFLACFPTGEDVRLALAERDGLLPLCGTCADELDELTVAWEVQARPPVASADCIADSYREATRYCSFCDDSVADGPLLGIESWSPGSAAPSRACADAVDHANFALCESCVPIFAEFLRGIAPDT